MDISNIKERWNATILDILKAFMDICERHDLTFYCCAGTAIGAVRHGGIIPWDDDIDVIMPRPDYDRLLEIAKTVPKPKKPDYFCYGMRFCGKYSTRCFMIGDVLYGSAENVEVKLLDFMTEIKASEFYKAIEEEESREKEQL